LYVNSITKVIRRGDIMPSVSPGHDFNIYGVGTKYEACHTADYVMRKVKKHESGKI